MLLPAFLFAIILILFSANHNNFRSSDLEMSLEHFNSPITIDSMRVYTYSRTKWFNRESFIVIGVFMESWITQKLRFEDVPLLDAYDKV